ncbi:Aminoacyl-tRNA synthetase, class Ic [Corchorus capsularis]|uniref:tyrosine--tRNA ligase n=1 Tax=Corchorus capsularis TaxID=210143 RepID=A0A1R3G863_COCAP|nr:Aminoacyl-tRNA synthetase, class Ic [Corchorus capsularis]
MDQLQNFQSLSINSQPSPSSTQLSLEERFKIIRSVGEECIQEDELLNLLKHKSEPISYDGFEPSGRMHIAQGVMKVINVNKLTSAGCRVKIWIADWFAQLNNKMGGDLEKIKIVGQYFIEIWKAAGMDLNGKVEFLWSSDEINSRAHEYMPLLMDIGRRNKLSRILRWTFVSWAWIKGKLICLQENMLPGLKQGQEKMSKSDPTSSIFMEDDEEEVVMKIKNAYCPPKIVEGNPCLEYIKYIILPWFNEFSLKRKVENGGDKVFKNFEELISDYESGEVNPDDLKDALSTALNKILQPVRDHFNNDPKAKDLLKRVKSFQVTR